MKRAQHTVESNRKVGEFERRPSSLVSIFSTNAGTGVLRAAGDAGANPTLEAIDAGVPGACLLSVGKPVPKPTGEAA